MSQNKKKISTYSPHFIKKSNHQWHFVLTRGQPWLCHVESASLSFSCIDTLNIVTLTRGKQDGGDMRYGLDSLLISNILGPLSIYLVSINTEMCALKCVARSKARSWIIQKKKKKNQNKRKIGKWRCLFSIDRKRLRWKKISILIWRHDVLTLYYDKKSLIYSLQIFSNN